MARFHTYTEVPSAANEKTMLSRNVLPIKSTDQHIKASFAWSKVGSSNSFVTYQI